MDPPPDRMIQAMASRVWGSFVAFLLTRFSLRGFDMVQEGHPEGGGHP